MIEHEGPFVVHASGAIRSLTTARDERDRKAREAALANAEAHVTQARIALLAEETLAAIQPEGASPWSNRFHTAESA